MDLQDFNKKFIKEFVESYGRDTSGWGFKPMSNEKPMNLEEVAKRKNEDAVLTLENLLVRYPAWSTRSHWSIYDWRSHLRREHYLTKDKNGDYNGIRWDRIHGKHRKLLKYKIKKNNEEIDRKYSVWDKYAGRQDVAYMRIKTYYLKDEVFSQPWFLEVVCDYFDPTYDYVYIKI